MVDYRQIYSHEAEQYERLVNREDHQGKLLPALQAIYPIEHSKVVELGTGTGRLARMLLPHVTSIVALDISRHMLDYCWEQLAKIDYQAKASRKWRLLQADNRQIPLKASWADLTLAGWTLGHLVGWQESTWRDHVDTAVSEMLRVTRNGGGIVIIETLGTGNEQPSPPNRQLGEYYRWLEDRWGFHRSWTRTDYLFESPSEAVNLTRFFFGDGIANRLERAQTRLLHECTGLWSMIKAGG